MGQHLVVNVDQNPKAGAETSQPVPQAERCWLIENNPEVMGPSSSMASEDENVLVEEEVNVEADEQAPLIGNGECRICQDEDTLDNLESPCACNGSLKYAHRKCVQRWCNEKGDITCEICHQSYQPDYTAPRPNSDEHTIDIGGVWQISGTQMDVHDPRLLAIAETERTLFEADYDDYNGIDSGGAVFCRSAALILMALLLLRHALYVGDGDGNGGSDSGGDEDSSTFFSIFLLRAVGFLLPCYIMIWAIAILQRRRQREEAAVASTQFAIVLQSAQNRGL